MKKLILFLLIFNYSTPLISQNLGQERVEIIKGSVVKILIDEKPSGTGFIVNKNCEIITCWHVIKPSIITDSLGHIISLRKIEIEISNGEKCEAGILSRLFKDKNKNAVAFDYCILKPISKLKSNFKFLKLGRFENINEGDQIVSCGYPLGIEQQFISTGILSTKWVDTVNVITNNLPETILRNVAWLDLTLNRGNSGGPVIKLGNSPEEDEVIGIATFILNPFAKISDTLYNLSSDLGVDISFGGISQVKVNMLFAKAISNNSIGISGCISINHMLDDF